MATREEAEALAIDEELARRKAVAEFGYFVKLAWHIVEPDVEYDHNWHVDAIGQHLEACVQGRIRNLIINIPPRLLKSTLIAVLFPAWVWLRFPGKRFLFGSYAMNLSVRDSIKCRRLIESEWYRSFFRVPWQMNSDQNRQDEFSNTRQGARIATSVDGAGTGKGGDFVVVDDPISATDAFSDSALEGARQWWDQQFANRAVDPRTVCRIIVMQRLHPLDLSGHLLKKGGWDHLKLPMEYEGEKNTTSIGWEDPRSTPGELLFPTRFGPQEVAQLKLDLGSMGYAGQEQQRPAAVEGSIIKKKWLLSHQYGALPSESTVRGEWVQSWDCTFKGEGVDKKKKVDYVVGQLWWRHPNGVDKYLVDQVRGRMSFTETVAAVKSFSAKWPKATLKLFEDKANGPAVIDTLKNQLTGIVAVQVHDSKTARAYAESVSFEAGNIHVPEPSLAPWIHDYIEEVTSFPNVANDDQLDATTQVLARWREKRAGDFSGDMVPKSNKTVSSRGGSEW